MSATDLQHPVADTSFQDWRRSVASDDEYRTLIFAPTGNDARLTAAFLHEAGWATQVVTSSDELCARIREGCGAILLAEEVLSPGNVAKIFGVLREQPAWSDLPVTLVTTGGSAGADRVRRLASIETYGNVTVLERPFRPATLVRSQEVALRSRRRQYQVRKLLSELAQARDAAERASRAKDDFLAALSHELRTPLNPVLLLASEAALDPELPLTVREDFGQIARNAQLEARLIDDLLDLTRITRGKLSLDLHPVDAHHALREALTTSQPEITEKHLQVETHFEAERFLVMADAVRLLQVLWNVIKNAVKFTPPRGVIRVATSVEGPMLAIAVSDTGIGMEEGEIQRVFDTFAQGNHARLNSGHRFGGLGLGLAISRMLMELHGGNITASSPGAGKGSTFCVRFPLAPEATVVRTPLTHKTGSRPPTGAKARRLLLVEDHQATRTALSRLLERRGYEVEAADSVAQARGMARNGVYNLVVSDLGLPDGTGYELMSELRDRYGLRGIALSGYGMENDVAQSRGAGFVTHLTKPVSIQSLDEALADVDPVGNPDE